MIRLGDQYLQAGAVAAGGWLVGRSWDGWWWLMGTFFISCAAFVVNEMVDRQDVDQASWNSIHVKENVNKNWAWAWLMLLSGVGLVAAGIANRLEWGVVMWILGLAYSVQPFRCKARVGWDVVVQELVWWVLPFWAMVWGKIPLADLGVLTLFGATVFWSGFLPYQLADIQADIRSGLKSTHAVMGMKNSLLFGFSLGVVAVVLFGVFRLDLVAWWGWAFLLFQLLVLGMYGYWWRLSDMERQRLAMQKYVVWAKPVTRLMVLGMVGLYLSGFSAQG
jgi:4-hydroxybenzoate polyprenyltransferase